MSRSFVSLSRAAVAAGLLGLTSGSPATAQDLSSLSLEELMEVEVTSVSKRSQKLSEAAAAVTVLTGDEIRRAGHTSIPEALRMVPGLHVARIDGNKWAVTSRGFNGRFANKLLVLIDGRSVYTPLFSGVYWAVQDVPLEDLDRIEVIRGPGGTLWGANAVNGVINIITKSAKETQGALLSAGGGSIERAFGTARWGGQAGDGIHYRVYGKGFDRDALRTSDNEEAMDGWDVLQGGFRLDWDVSDRDSLTLQGDVYDGDADQGFRFTGARDRIDLGGGNLLARWNRRVSDASDVMVQLYYDRTEREEVLATEERDTVDLEFQHDLSLAPGRQLTWGLNYRFTSDQIDNSPFTQFDPDDQSDHLAGAFAQLQQTLIEDRLVATLGSKFEYNEYSGVEYQPSVRMAWTPSERHTIWSAVSRTVRTPSRADQTVRIGLPSEFPGVILDLQGTRDMDSEDLLAYELGYRGVLLPNWTLDAAAFWFDYGDVRSVDLTGAPFPAPPTSPFFGFFLQPAQFGNTLDAESYGVELETTWQPLDSWKLTAGWTLFKLQIDKESGSTDVIGKRTEDDSPAHQLHLRSSWDLPGNVALDAAVYYVGEIEGQGIGSYWRGDLRIGWKPREDLELFVVGQNLFDHAHAEYSEFFAIPSEVPRSVWAGVTWRR